MTPHLSALAEKWYDLAAHIREHYHDEPRARLHEVHAEELEAVIRTADDELLTLRQAAEWSGYSPDHLGRMVRTGSLPNAGRKGSPRIRAGDLPRKPGLPRETPSPQLVGSSRSQVARSVLSRRGG